MDKQELENLLVDYGCVFTNALADRLMKDYQKLNSIENILLTCDLCIQESKSEWERTCAREVALKHIYKAMRGEENG